MKSFEEYTQLTPQEQQLMEEAVRQFKDVTKDAEELARKCERKSLSCNTHRQENTSLHQTEMMFANLKEKVLKS